MAVLLGALKKISKKEFNANTMRRLIYDSHRNIMDNRELLRREDLDPIYIAFLKDEIKKNKAFIKKHS